MRASPRRAAAALAGLALVSAPACGPAEPDGAAAAVAPRAIEHAEGAVCGMIVRNQTAPRGQVVHRDGTHLFLCSIGDLLVHLDAPSPHGRARHVFVEAMDPERDPLQSFPETHPWIDAASAVYVLGVPRSGVMGPPVLSYARRADAERVAARFDGARIVDYAGLRDWWTTRQADGESHPHH